MDPIIKFGRDKAGYTSDKPNVTYTHGDLYLDGILFRSNLPFALIQYERVKLIRQGVITKRITIKYHSK